MKISELTNLFFHDLKQFNPSQFNILCTADLTTIDEDIVTYKACSSVITRFFIFRDKHRDISDIDMKLLYYNLSIDRIAGYFSEYPSASYEDLLPFQFEMKRYVKQRKEELGKHGSMYESAS
jgi:hypothetical protein